jgi:hypothetical protein
MCRKNKTRFQKKRREVCCPDPVGISVIGTGMNWRRGRIRTSTPSSGTSSRPKRQTRLCGNSRRGSSDSSSLISAQSTRQPDAEQCEAAPPPVHVVRFENFSQSTVENIARSTALITTGSRAGVFDSAVDGLANFLKGTESGGRTTSVTIERAGEAEVLSLTEETGSIALLKEPISWHSSTIEEATATRWRETFGEDAKLAPSSDALIVRFGDKSGTGCRNGTHQTPWYHRQA